MNGPEHLIEFFHGYTYSAHPLACAAALGTLDTYADEGLLTRAAELEGYFADALHSLRGLPNVIDVRNIGLVGGIELAPLTGEPAKRAFSVFLDCWEQGLLIRTTGDTIALSPPLIVEQAADRPDRRHDRDRAQARSLNRARPRRRATTQGPPSAYRMSLLRADQGLTRASYYAASAPREMSFAALRRLDRGRRGDRRRWLGRPVGGDRAGRSRLLGRAARGARDRLGCFRPQRRAGDPWPGLRPGHDRGPARPRRGRTGVGDVDRGARPDPRANRALRHRLRLAATATSGWPSTRARRPSCANGATGCRSATTIP